MTDRERELKKLVLQMSQGRDKLAARVEALEARAKDLEDIVRGLLTGGDGMTGSQFGAIIMRAESALKENQTCR